VGQGPKAERAARETVNLPQHVQVTEREAQRVLVFLFKSAQRTGQG